MARSVKQWVGRDDDTPVPPRVRLRVFDAKDGRCHACGRKIMPGERWTCEHVIALINWNATPDEPHGNRESNLDLTCCNCLPGKNAADVAEKANTYAKRAKHTLPHKPKCRWPKRPMNQRYQSNAKDVNDL